VEDEQMQVRYPTFDFSKTTPHWNTNTELAQFINAGNIIPAYIEPFLIKVMRKARAELDPVADAELIADIDTFNKQEAQHMKVHRAMLTLVRENGYEGMASIEKAYEGDYERFLEEKPLNWLLAYCEGFEAFGSTAAEKWVDGHIEDRIEGADPEIVKMFRWHLAEEFEHRTVCHRVYQRLGSQGGPVRAYLRRLRGLYDAATHMNGYAVKLCDYLVSVDQQNMTPEEKAASDERLKQAKKVRAAPSLKNLVRILMPWYDPANTTPPRRYESALEVYAA
jgi:predicted metal-dependent hydrolase